jgi:hypothetical protein
MIGHEFTGGHPVSHTLSFHLIGDHLLDLFAVLDIDDIKAAQIFIGRINMNRPHPKNFLDQRPFQTDIHNTVKANLLFRSIQEPFFNKQPILGHPVFGKGPRQTTP